MELSHFQNRKISEFVIGLNGQGFRLPSDRKGRPVLYLKCWGSDYPYLQGVGQQKRWLPVEVDFTHRYPVRY
jgi:hypothetical protein